MTTTYIGEETIGACIPVPVGLVLKAQADLQAQIPPLEISVGLPTVSIAAQIEGLQLTISQLQLCLELGITPPSISAQLGLLEAKLIALRAELAVFLQLSQFFAAAGVFAYAIDAATNAAGAELTAALASGFPGHAPTAHANLLVLGTVDAATWTAMAQVFKTTP